MKGFMQGETVGLNKGDYYVVVGNKNGHTAIGVGKVENGDVTMLVNAKVKGTMTSKELMETAERHLEKVAGELINVRRMQ